MDFVKKAMSGGGDKDKKEESTEQKQDYVDKGMYTHNHQPLPLPAPRVASWTCILCVARSRAPSSC